MSWVAAVTGGDGRRVARYGRTRAQTAAKLTASLR